MTRESLAYLDTLQGVIIVQDSLSPNKVRHKACMAAEYQDASLQTEQEVTNSVLDIYSNSLRT